MSFAVLYVCLVVFAVILAIIIGLFRYKVECLNERIEMLKVIISAKNDGKKKKPLDLKPETYTTIWAKCPTCKELITNRENVCTKCGQILDWSEADEPTGSNNRAE